MRLELNGIFRLTDEQDRDIAITGRYAPALLALVATAHRQTRSRNSLRAILWPRSPEAQSQSSLRTLLTALRRDLGPHAACLVSDRRSISLVDVTLQEARSTGATFFEDAPSIGEEFEDWLSTQRSASGHRADLRLAPMAVDDGKLSERPCIAIYPPEVTTDEPHAAHVATRIVGQLRQHLCMMDMAQVLDLSSLGDNRFADPLVPSQKVPDVALLVSLSKVRNFAEIGIRAFEPTTKQLLWSASISADQSSTFLFSPDQIDAFVNQAIESLNIACLRLVERGGVGRNRAPESMFGAVHTVLGMTVAGQTHARQFIRTRSSLENSAVAAAWYAFSLANTLGEAGDRRDVMAEADEYSRRALELNPSNALVLTLVSHVQSFVMRRLLFGAELARSARQMAPSLAISWDISAMNSVYRGEFEEATAFSAAAVRLGRFSPYLPVFKSSQAISASLSGSHETAIALSERVLERIPNFLAVQRHLSASLAAAGRIEESRRLIGTIRARDPAFSLTGVTDPDYPLPSPHSIQLVQRGFKAAGLVQ